MHFILKKTIKKTSNINNLNYMICRFSGENKTVGRISEFTWQCQQNNKHTPKDMHHYMWSNHQSLQTVFMDTSEQKAEPTQSLRKAPLAICHQAPLTFLSSLQPADYNYRWGHFREPFEGISCMKTSTGTPRHRNWNLSLLAPPFLCSYL